MAGEVIEILNLTEQSVTGSGGGGGGKIDTDPAFLTDMRVHGDIKINEIKIESSTQHMRKVFLKTPANTEHVINIDMKQLALRQGHKITVVALDAPLEAGVVPSEAIVSIYNHNTKTRSISAEKVSNLTKVEDRTPLRAYAGVVGLPLVGLFIAIFIFGLQI